MEDDNDMIKADEKTKLKPRTAIGTEEGSFQPQPLTLVKH
jgi:hypothetical protein